MIRPGFHRTNPLRAQKLVLILAASFLIFGACGLFNAKNRFSQDLIAIDSLTESGKTAKALKGLNKLRKRAVTASQFLSVAKRERGLLAWDEAVDTLSVATFKMPANDALRAVLVDTLARASHRDEALTQSERLITTTYAVQGAALRLSEPESVRDPRWWKVAAELTELPVFARNAAVWFAAEGNLPAACASAAALKNGGDARERRLLALLYYDAGFPQQSLQTLKVPEGSQSSEWLTEPDINLLADASLETGDTAEAMRYWATLISDYPESSPVPWYNLAIESQDIAQANEYLAGLLDRFPSYFPGIARYVGNYLVSGPQPERDSLTRSLESRGFYSLSMKQSQKEAYPAKEQVSGRLNAAIASVSGDPDIRLFIEEIKVAERDTMNAGITASRIWNLLERFSSNDLLVRYAMWFFLRTGESDTAFSLNRERIGATDPFYDALEAAAKGDLDGAVAAFNKCAASKEDSWAALANIGTIRERKGDVASAIEFYDRATSFAPNDNAASDLQLDAAMILARARDTRRAEQVLMRALELDPKNERAAAQLRKLRGL